MGIRLWTLFNIYEKFVKYTALVATSYKHDCMQGMTVIYISAGVVRQVRHSERNENRCKRIDGLKAQ